MAEGQSGQGDARHRRRRQRIACRRRLLPEAHRHALPVRALSRHRPGDAGPGRRTDRPHVRPGGELAAAGAQRQRQGLRGHRQDRACRRRPTSRRWTRPACRASTSRSGTRSGCRRARRRTSSRSSTPPSSRRWPIRWCASASTISVRRFRRASSKRRRRCRASQGRDREVVADHQGGEHQGRVIPDALFADDLASAFPSPIPA